MKLIKYRYPCTEEEDLFYSPSDDGRTEAGRTEREALAGIVCRSCPFEMTCLYESLVTQERWGVWGGLGEGERRRFLAWLKDQGYNIKNGDLPPPGKMLRSALLHFREVEPSPEVRYHGAVAS